MSEQLPVTDRVKITRMRLFHLLGGAGEYTDDERAYEIWDSQLAFRESCVDWRRETMSAVK